MPVARRRPVRLIHTRAGPRYLVQVPEPSCPIPGWRAYAVLAFGMNGNGHQRLTLYERVDNRKETSDGPRAA